MKMPWTKDPAPPLYMPSPTVTQLDRPEPEDEGDVLPDPPRPMVPNALDQLRADYAKLRNERLHLPWTTDPPTTPGLYWWRPNPLGDLPDDMAVHEVVVDFGGRMCVVTKKGDSTMYSGVSSLAREWAGPIGVPEGVNLEKWWGLADA